MLAPASVFARRLPLALVAALALLALALPSAALAQSAGDEQYTDPFGQVDEGTGSGGNGGNGEGNVPAEPAPTPVEPAQTGQETVAPTGETLPRTGLHAVALALVGAGSLAAGAALRRRL
jgi:hypothetical protein